MQKHPLAPSAVFFAFTVTGSGEARASSEMRLDAGPPRARASLPTR